VAFGGLKAVADVGFVARPGAITSVIGPNGAGKTTLLNLISGFQAADRGSVRLAGQELAGLPAHATSRAGIARSWQTSQLFESLSVGDNLRVAALRGALFHPALRGRWRGETAGAEALLALVGFGGGSAAESAGLPHVDRRLVEIARALATRPRALLLDEPAAGLDQADTVKLGALLRRIAGTGIAVVLVEHDMGLVMQVSDHILVLDAGRKIAEGSPTEVRANPAVREAYLGHGGAPAAPRPPRPPGEPLLDVAALEAGYGALPVLRGLDLSVKRGEMVALLGPNGAGKSTLMKALSGLLRPVAGHVGFAGQRIATLPAHQVARAGLVLVPEGRQVFPQLSVKANLRLGATRRRDFDAAVEIEAMLRRFPRLRERLHNDAGLLSGGEQQMLALARGLLARPEILLLDEPSLGLAPAVVDELFRQLAALRDEGLTLLLVDQMADLALSLADRCYLLGGGRILRHGSAAEMRDALDYFTEEDAA
jgi:ABC-type branched-subunit amino acid transport system ATPase component